MTEQQRQILVETVKTFGAQEWFREASVWAKHPITGEPTLEFLVNYVPLFERKNVLTFAEKYNLALKFTEIDRDGKKKE